jgi:hypothetical protein
MATPNKKSAASANFDDTPQKLEYTLTTPVKFLEGIGAEGGKVWLTADEAAELRALGAIVE